MMDTLPENAPKPVAVWRITMRILWAALWLYVAVKAASLDMAPFVKQVFAVFSVPYGIYNGLMAYRSWQKRHILSARLRHPHTAPKTSVTFSASPTHNTLVYMIMCLIGVCWCIRMLVLSETDAAARLSFLPVLISAFSGLAYFFSILISAKKCVFHAETETFALYRRSKNPFAWTLEAEYPFGDFVGIQREITSGHTEKIWLVGKRQNVLIGTAHALRAGRYMREEMANMYAATGLPILETIK